MTRRRLARQSFRGLGCASGLCVLALRFCSCAAADGAGRSAEQGACAAALRLPLRQPAPSGSRSAAVTGRGRCKAHPGSFIRMNVDMVLVPVTVTDP